VGALLMQFSTHTGMAKHKHAVDGTIILFTHTPALSVLFFSIIEHSVLMALVLLHRHVRKGIDAKNPAILSFSLLPKEPKQMQGMCSSSKNRDRLL